MNRKFVGLLIVLVLRVHAPDRLGQNLTAIGVQLSGGNGRRFSRVLPRRSRRDQETDCRDQGESLSTRCDGHAAGVRYRIAHWRRYRSSRRTGGADASRQGHCAMLPRFVNRKAAVSSQTSPSTKTCTTCWPRSTAPSSIASGTYFFQTTLRDYRRAGVDRDDATRAKIKALQDELVKIGQQFDMNIAADVRKLQLNAADLDGLPEDFKRSHQPDASGKVTLSTDNTDYFPFMDYAISEPARKAFYILYRQRAYPKNIDTMAQLLQKRHELANVLGYPDWAAYITADKMVATEQNASDFIEKISTAAQAGSKRDYEELLAFKKEKKIPKRTSVDAWDIAHLDRGAKIEKFGYDAQVMRPYFEYSRVLQGILDISSQMYGISYKPVTTRRCGIRKLPCTTFSIMTTASVGFTSTCFRAKTSTNTTPRSLWPPARQGFRLPEYVLVCNFPRATGEPGLMERRRRHHLLPRVWTSDARNHAKATRSGRPAIWRTTFIEAPSQMFEEWPKDPAILKTVRAPLQNQRAAAGGAGRESQGCRDFGRALNVRQQMFYAAISLDFYNRDPQGLDQDKLVAQLQERYTPLQIRGRHAHADRIRPPQRLLRGLLHLHVVAGHREGHVHRVQEERIDEYGSRGEISQLDFLAPAAPSRRPIWSSDFLGRPYSFQAYADWLNGK